MISIMKLRFNLAVWTVAVIVLGFCTRPACAQIPDDVKEIFERLVEELDDDLAEKFRAALKKRSSTVEFTPSQFRRFRSSPANPFDGLDEVDAKDGAGNIALKFELPSLRQRTLSLRERQHPQQLKEFRSVVGSAAASTVGIFEGEKQVALGIVMDAEGLILTKASEVENREQLFCRLPNGRRVTAVLAQSDTRNDVALLTVDTKLSGSLTPVQWSFNQPLLGAFVIVPDFHSEAIAVGTLSTNVRSTMSGEQAFLGVQPQTTPQGVMVSEIRPGTASYEAGLRNGDIILSLDGQSMRDVSDFVYLIRTKQPGDKVEIEYLRGNEKRLSTAKLAGRRLSGERAARFKMMSRLGAIPSRRADGFPVVFQHDAPLFPEQCGGPIVDLDGAVIGMNIARNGRAASYAIPSNHLQTLIENFKQISIAQRISENIQN
jgi:S1-C subfamily serine protease